MQVFWTQIAERTYFDEIDFISRKWNEKEVDKFVLLVENFIQILESGILIGAPYSIENVRFSVISKQTSLVYKIYTNTDRIDLLLFWNNKRDPKDFEKFLKK